ncbi:LacI family DNA-binding transcriptional regulator [Oceanobacillus alkalisoli]|uniref:LacI family DNA-binding transcriptional regulator n=1 Tax=Oceanobacillus alkalisoli TaxID=2925113 RepID=UPI001EF003C6|nr:LacI family DNA-binding transcriptional regulator [Oceanobacillus alkalisoli]MCF3944163.1 LacI family DNA-binding transcriptional regulator [Oceanobacillus alkalisoli]MCG5102552.1 LacI family DNA-binding transcriptional regulator [Oceanobacillus alkalisoli]
MANIQDVAQAAGVSVATVSRFFNDRSAVSLKSRKKVDEAIKQLNYEPSVLARNLRKTESRLLLVLIPKISNPFYSEIINGIQDVAINNRYNILLCETDSNPEREDIYFNLVRNKMADGIITMDPAVQVDSLIELAASHPIIQCSEYAVESGIPYVTIDHEEAAYQAVRHLIQLGHKEIALINSHEKFLYSRKRENGYKRALEKDNLPFNEEWIIRCEELEFINGQLAMRKILGGNNRPTAVFAVSDLLAIGALKELHHAELNVPNDVALVGFDKIAFSNMTYPALTTVAQPMYEMGKLSAKMLIDKIKGKEVENVTLDFELVIRESTLGR